VELLRGGDGASAWLLARPPQLRGDSVHSRRSCPPSRSIASSSLPTAATSAPRVCSCTTHRLNSPLWVPHHTPITTYIYQNQSTNAPYEPADRLLIVSRAVTQLQQSPRDASGSGSRTRGGGGACAAVRGGVPPAAPPPHESPPPGAGWAVAPPPACGLR
jgi:hypothetical protein